MKKEYFSPACQREDFFPFGALCGGSDLPSEANQAVNTGGWRFVLIFGVFILMVVGGLILEDRKVAKDCSGNCDPFNVGAEWADTGFGAHYAEDGFFLWREGDNIGVWEGTDEISEYVLAGSGDAPVTSFRLKGRKRGGESRRIENNLAIFPYHAEMRLDMLAPGSYWIGGELIPPLQFYCTEGFDRNAFPMIAVTDGTADREFQFRNLCGVVRLSLLGSGEVNSISLYGNGGETIAGSGYLNITYGEEQIHSVWNCRVVTLDCSLSPVRLSPQQGTDFYFCLAPTVFHEGVTFEISADGETFPLVSGKRQAVRRSSILSLPPVRLSDGSFDIEPGDDLTDI